MAVTFPCDPPGGGGSYAIMSGDSTPGSERPDDSAPSDKSRDPRRDPMAPPEEPCECFCLHCRRIFMSDKMWFQRVVGAKDGFPGFWMCPTPNCDGAGFTFDIFPTDPDHPANEGWYDDDDDEEEEVSDEASNDAKEWDPAEPDYAALDEEFGDADDDLIEGDEWKLGLAPGERPPEPEWAEQARKEWEEEQRKYDAPDERPRVLDWSNEDRPPAFKDDDIPFRSQRSCLERKPFRFVILGAA